MMIRRRNIITLLFSLLLGSSLWGQNDSIFALEESYLAVYDAYASRPGVTVAQLIHFPIDSNVFTNALMIQACNDSINDILIDEMDSSARSLIRNGKPCSIFSCESLRSDIRQLPPLDSLTGRVDHNKSCSVVYIKRDRTFWVFFTKTTEEYYALCAIIDPLIIKYISNCASENNTEK